MTVGFNVTRRHLAAILSACAAAFGSASQATEALVIENAWIRAAPPNATVMAGYMTVVNNGAAPVTIKSAASPDFGKVEIHESISHDGRMHMQPRPELTIDAHGRVTFKPNGLHMMLMEPKRRLQTNDHAAVTLKLDNGGELRVDLAVKSDDSDASNSETPQHHHH